MATPPSIATLKEADLKIPDGAISGKQLTAVFHLLFAQLNPYFNGLNKALARGLTLADNMRCDIITAKFSHGMPQDVALHTLTKAAGLVVLGADGHLVSGFTLAMKGASMVTLTFWFNDAAATSVSVGCALFEDGQQSSTVVPPYSPSSGIGTILAGQTSATISNPAATAKSNIVVTPQGMDATLIVISVTSRAAGTFTVTGNASAHADVLFSYVIS